MTLSFEPVNTKYTTVIIDSEPNSPLIQSIIDEKENNQDYNTIIIILIMIQYIKLFKTH